jgi:hypothetical protein
MGIIHYDLGNLNKGEVIQISLSGNAANVRLLDQQNFLNYRTGHSYRGYGGLARKSPVNLVIPNFGHWHIAIDMKGLRGSTKASVRVMS